MLRFRQLVLLCCLAILASTTAVTQEPDVVVLDRLVNKCIEQMRTCEQRRAEIEPQYVAEINDNLVLRAKVGTLEQQLSRKATIDKGIAGLCFGLGIGMAVMFALGIRRALRRLKPLSPQRKRLLSAIVGASWITVVLTLLLVGGQDDLTQVASTALLLSIPGVLFSGIAFWWFGQSPIPEAASANSFISTEVPNSAPVERSRKPWAAISGVAVIALVLVLAVSSQQLLAKFLGIVIVGSIFGVISLIAGTVQTWRRKRKPEGK